MFWRILWRLLHASRGRLGLALMAVASGAAVCAALLNLNLDATQKLTREFRTLGANAVIAPQNASNASTVDASVLGKVAALHAGELTGAAPYLYLSGEAGDQGKAAPVIVAGTWLDEAARISSWWKVEGQWISDRNSRDECMVGRAAARQFGVAPGQTLAVRYGQREAKLRVAGVVTSGGSEDSQVFIGLGLAQELAGLPNRVSLVQLSIRGTAPQIDTAIRGLSANLPGVDVHPVRQLAAAEGQLLDRIRGLLFATVVFILLLTSLGVLATMAGLALERRRDVGLMKALGGSVQRVMRFFLAEAMVIGLIGGIAGWGAGVLLAEWIGVRVFATVVEPRLVVLPVTLGLMILVTLAGALPLRLLGRVRPSEILRGE